MKTNKVGFTLIEVMIVVAIIGLLAAIAILCYSRAKTDAQRAECFKNLQAIEGVQKQWKTENPTHDDEAKWVPGTLEWRLTNNGGILPICPADADHSFRTSYEVKDSSTPPVCRILPESHHLLKQ